MDIEDLVGRLCTMAGIIMEDASVGAISAGSRSQLAGGSVGAGRARHWRDGRGGRGAGGKINVAAGLTERRAERLLAPMGRLPFD